MKAIILAAGEGSRLRPLTLSRPKSMLEIAGQPLLQMQLRVLESQGVTPRILVGGHLREMLPDTGHPSRVNPRYRKTNMTATLFCAEEDLRGTVLVSYGDIVYPPDVLRRIMDAPHDVAVAVDRDWEAYWRLRFDDPLDDAETLRLDEAGRIVDIGRPPDSINEVQGQYIGLIKFTQRGLDALRAAWTSLAAKGTPSGRDADSAYMTDLLQALIDDGQPVHPVFFHGGWVEIDTLRDLSLPENARRVAAILDDLESGGRALGYPETGGR